MLKYWSSKNILIPLEKTLSGRNYFKAKRFQSFLEKTEYLNREAIDIYRNETFIHLINHCFTNVPFYRSMMRINGISPKDIKDISDIQKIPILTKATINESTNQFRADTYGEKDIRIMPSGGSTGSPVRVGRDLKNEYKVDANNWRMWRYAGYELGMKTVMFWGNRQELRKEHTLHYKTKMFIENTRLLNVFDLNEERLKNLISFVNKKKPTILRGYASSIYNFVRYCKENQIAVNCHPKSIILTSDKIYEKEKQLIKDFFEAPVFEEYGCRETSIIAHECEQHCGFHIAEEMFIIETKNTSGKCGFSGQGEIVLTSLSNFGFPLLRYHLGDEAVISDSICKCGRNLRMLSDIKGKIGDSIILKSGTKVDGNFFTILLNDCKSIKNYQIRQSDIGNATISIVKSNQFQESEIKRMVEFIYSTYANNINLKIDYVNSIPIIESGKRRAVISTVIG